MENLRDHDQWPAVEMVLRKLHDGGHQAYLAGGCVRDSILGRIPKDFDVASDASPDQVEALFEKTISVGKAFGIIMIPFDGFQVEVARFRQDGPYKDGRHPENVNFECSAEEDAKRRDFTINALFYDIETNQVIDYVEGVKDIKNRIIRTVGDPYKRYEEDKLRMLRAVRFAAQLGFELEKETFKAINTLADQIHQVSQERIFNELNSILKLPTRVKGINELFLSGLGERLLPKLDIAKGESFTDQEFWTLTKLGLENLKEENHLELLWSALYLFQLYKWHEEGLHFWEEGVQIISEEMKAFKCSNAFLKSFAYIVGQFLHLKKFTKDDPPEALMILNSDEGNQLIKLWALENHALGKSSEQLDELVDQFKSLSKSNGKLPDCFLNGDDLLKLGFVPGPQIKETLHKVYKKQLIGDLNSKTEAQKWVESQKKV